MTTTNDYGSGVPADDLVLRDALAEHYTAHGLPPNGGAEDAWFSVQLGPIRGDPGGRRLVCPSA